MKLLISPKNEEEALEAIKGGADIIDVKNPKEGSLGANFPWVISCIRDLTPSEIEVSATIGNFPNLPGTASLAALGALVAGANYIKVGLYGVSNEDDAVELGMAVVKAVKDYNPKAMVVLAGYADYHRIKPQAVEASKIPGICHRAKADVAMLDTAVKDGKTLFDHLSIEDLDRFVSEAHDYGILAAFGGSIGVDHLEALHGIGLDVVGIRGAACEKGDRMKGSIKASKVRRLREIIDGF